MSSRPDVSIVIVNWNSREFLDGALAAVTARVTGVSYETIVVDSASFDGADAMIGTKYPTVRFIQSDVNVGFGRASSLGATYATGTALLFLNPDTEVRAGAVERMFAAVTAHRDVGAVGCRLLNTDGTLQTSCVQALPTVLNQLLDAEAIRKMVPGSRLFGARALRSVAPPVEEVEAVSGACLMLRRDLFAAVGGFSPEYFMYGEDMDLCFKVRQRGARNLHVKQALVVHHGGGSSQHRVSHFSTVMFADSVNRLLVVSRGRLSGHLHRAALTLGALARLAVLWLVLVPLAGAAGRPAARRVSAARWMSILRWGLGLEGWTARYNGTPDVRLVLGGVQGTCVGSAEN